MQSGDPRWVNPTIMQNEQFQQQTAAASQQQQQAPEEEQPSEENDKLEQVRQAMILVKQMKEKGVENRTAREQRNYKAAILIIAKNPEEAQQMGGGYK